MEEKKMFKAIFYTDGGCFPKSGAAGAGAHGYIYRDDNTIRSASPAKHVLTSIGVVPKERITEDMVTVLPNEYIDIYNSMGIGQTNNRAELQGFIDALEFVLSEDNIDEVLIVSDSTYVLFRSGKAIKDDVMLNDLISVIPDLANNDLWQKVGIVIKKALDKDIKITLDKVLAHSGHSSNDRADMLATVGRNMSAKGVESKIEITRSDPKNYWNPKVTKSNLLSFRRLFFNTHTDYDVCGEYMLANYKDIEDTGKKLPFISYAVLKLSEPLEVIEKIKGLFFDHMNGENIMAVIKTDIIFSPAVYANLIKDPNAYLTFRTTPIGNIEAVYIDKRVVATTIYPPLLSLRVTDIREYLTDIVNKATVTPLTDINSKEDELTFSAKDSGNVVMTYDITGLIYAESDKGPVLSTKIINNGVLKGTFKSNGKSRRFDLVLGEDLLNRNELKRLEKKNPKVTLVMVRETKEQIKIMTLVESVEGSGLWSNHYSNIIIT